MNDTKSADSNKAPKWLFWLMIVSVSITLYFSIRIIALLGNLYHLNVGKTYSLVEEENPFESRDYYRVLDMKDGWVLYARYLCRETDYSCEPLSVLSSSNVRFIAGKRETMNKSVIDSIDSLEKSKNKIK